MARSPFNRQHRSIRLRHYDYGASGAYFIPLCVQNRTCLFGDVIGGSMVLNGLGKIAATEWQRTAEIRPNVAVMPNHFHALLAM